MEDYEEIILIATSENLICFAMSNYIVRVCSIFGNQRGVVSIPGPVVSMSTYKNILLVAYHVAGVRDEDQCISLRLITFEGKISLSNKLLGSHNSLKDMSVEFQFIKHKHIYYFFSEKLN